MWSARCDKPEEESILTNKTTESQTVASTVDLNMSMVDALPMKKKATTVEREITLKKSADLMAMRTKTRRSSEDDNKENQIKLQDYPHPLT